MRARGAESNRGTALGRSLGLAMALAALVLLAVAPGAGADLTLCTPGSAAGQCDEPLGIASDSADGRTYLADAENNRIDVFDSSGAFLAAFGWGVADGTSNELQSCTLTCFKGIAGAGAGQLSYPQRVAVDNDPASPSRHDVYVYDSHNFRVQKFAPDGTFLLSFGSHGSGPGQFAQEKDAVAVGPGGIVYVSDSPGNEASGFTPRVEKFQPDGSFVEAVALAHAEFLNQGFAVDSAGNLYAAFNGGGGIFKFHPDGSAFGAPYPLDPGVETSTLTVDGADRLFAGQVERNARGFGRFVVIGAYDKAGEHIARFGYGRIASNLMGLAFFHSGAGDLFGSEEGRRQGVKYLPLPPPGPIVAPPSVKVSAVSNTKVQLEAEINPEGKETTYQINYVDQESFEKEGGFASPATKSTAPAPLEVPLGKEFNLAYVKAPAGCKDPVTEIGGGSCLEPKTTYRFEVVAKNTDGEDTVEGEPFTTEPLAKVRSYATGPASDTAILHAEVNPLGVATSGRFQFVDDAAYRISGFKGATLLPPPGQPPLGFGSGEAFVSRAVSAYPLTPHTLYHYRFVASDPLLEEIPGPEHTYATFAAPASAECPNDAFRSGAGAFLPDCRAYEMVSPEEKNNADIFAPEEATDHKPARMDRSSPDGQRLTYSASQAFGDAQSAPYVSQYIASRGPDGWTSQAISPPRSSPTMSFVQLFDTEFKTFSPDLCESWVRTAFEPVLAPGGIAGFPNLYRRDNCGAGAGSYEALTIAKPTHILSASPFPAELYSSLELQGTSADGTHALFTLRESLAGAFPQSGKCLNELIGGSQCGLRLYEYVAGKPLLRPVCVLPGGGPYPGPCSAGMAGESVGLSHNGSFQNAISQDGQRIFWTAAHDVGTGAGRIYVRIGAAQTVAVSEAAEEATGSASSFLAAAADGSSALFTSGGDLYRFDVDAEATKLIAAKVEGVIGVSQDASRVYLVSGAVLSGEEENSEGAKAEANGQNLYLYEAGADRFRFIANLAPSDLAPEVFPSSVARRSIKHIARVSDDGLQAAFSSRAPLTGYDNTDAASPLPCAEDEEACDGEVFVYDASARGGLGELSCASCNPTGARPLGVNIGNNVDRYPVAAHLPALQNNFYGSHVLSDGGRRVLFESSDVLSPRDTNGAADVYQWEAAGEGGCSAASPTFSPAEEGCVDLISSGQSPSGSEIIDASPSGDDVFFTTLSGLVPGDSGLIDIYDARVGGGFPPPAPPAPHCEGEACQSPPAPPAPLSPASAAYAGPGNVKAPSKRKPHRKKHQRKRQARHAHKGAPHKHSHRRAAR